MDRKVKRPRSTTPTTGDQLLSSPPKKKSKSGSTTTKKTKKPKRHRADSGVSPDPNAAAAASAAGTAIAAGSGGSTKPITKLKKSSASTTATADGQMMSQMLSTFSKLEQSRFEAFKRSSLDAHVIEEYVAACVSHRLNRGLVSSTGGTTSSSSRGVSHKLSDLVTPGQAPDIALVVSTLAKIYAQRLVAAAVVVRKERQQPRTNDKDNDNSGTTAGSSSTANSTAAAASAAEDDDNNRPLEPEDLMKAYQRRVQEGLDPGFYLQAHDGLNLQITTVHSSNDYNQRRLAAMEAQEAYDKAMAKQQSQKQQQQQTHQQIEKEGGEDGEVVDTIMLDTERDNDDGGGDDAPATLEESCSNANDPQAQATNAMSE